MSMHPPPDPDELASDLVDGLLPEDEAARLRSDPAIVARVEAIEAARAALRVPPPSPPGAVDRALAATFAALDRGMSTAAGASDVSGERPPPVTHLRSVGPPGGGAPAAGGPWAPAHRAKRRSSGMQWLAAAAAIVLLGLVTIGILSGSGSDDTTSDTAAMSAEEGTAAEGGDAGAEPQDDVLSTEEGPSQESAGAAGEVPSASEPTTTARPGASSEQVTDLGDVSTADELADRIREQPEALGEVSSDTPDATGSFDESGAPDTRTLCDELTALGDTSRGHAVYVADAVLAGEPVRVHLYDQGDGDLRLVATNMSCATVVDMPYSP